MNEEQHVFRVNPSFPAESKRLRACLLCSLVKTQTQFRREGCDNCEDILHLRDNTERINACTTPSFSGSIAVCDPESSWVAQWQRVKHRVMGMYAMGMQGSLPEEVISLLEDHGIPYRRPE